MKARIGRFDGDTIKYEVEDSATINDLLEAADITLGKGEIVVTDDGEGVSVTDTVEERMEYLVVSAYKQGISA